MYELMDTFQKYEQSLEQSCRKNERLFTDLKSELDAQMDLEIEVGGGQGKIPAQSVEQYLQNFNWNQFRFKMQDKALSVLGANLYAV